MGNLVRRGTLSGRVGHGQLQPELALVCLRHHWNACHSGIRRTALEYPRETNSINARVNFPCAFLLKNNGSSPITRLPSRTVSLSLPTLSKIVPHPRNQPRRRSNWQQSGGSVFRAH